MCAIFGLLDPRENFSRKEKQRIIQTLGWEAQIRGTDATGLAWVEKSRIGIRKAPCAARRFAFRFPGEVKILMGHTRMTTPSLGKLEPPPSPWPTTVYSTMTMPFAGSTACPAAGCRPTPMWRCSCWRRRC